jgi:hypothetical protein
MLRSKSGEKVSGLTKICYYSSAKSEGALTKTTYETCPRWTPRLAVEPKQQIRTKWKFAIVERGTLVY